jgi:hypothetical protein
MLQKLRDKAFPELEQCHRHAGARQNLELFTDPDARGSDQSRDRKGAVGRTKDEG